jgi:hypothetical protein
MRIHPAKIHLREISAAPLLAVSHQFPAPKNPSDGRLLVHLATDYYFSELVADRENGELYGISLRDPIWGRGIELVRMDARDGTILQSRVLESDYWRIAFAPLRTVPAADVRALISAKK